MQANQTSLRIQMNRLIGMLGVKTVLSPMTYVYNRYIPYYAIICMIILNISIQLIANKFIRSFSLVIYIPHSLFTVY